jgi:regulatory protein YycH of two-component signal transduction system YycFG
VDASEGRALSPAHGIPLISRPRWASPRSAKAHRQDLRTHRFLSYPGGTLSGMELFTDNVSIDRLEQVLLDGESLVAQVRARQAEALAQLQGTKVLETDGSRSMLDWTAAKLDVTHDTARDLLTLAQGPR